MDQNGLNKWVHEFSDIKPILILCKNCRKHITWFRLIEVHNKNFWKLDLEDIDPECDLEFCGNVFCECRHIIGLSYSRRTILIRKNAVIIDH